MCIFVQINYIFHCVHQLHTSLILAKSPHDCNVASSMHWRRDRTCWLKCSQAALVCVCVCVILLLWQFGLYLESTQFTYQSCCIHFCIICHPALACFCCRSCLKHYNLKTEAVLCRQMYIYIWHSCSGHYDKNVSLAWQLSRWCDTTDMIKLHIVWEVKANCLQRQLI